MMKGVMGQQNSCKTLIGVHEMHTYTVDTAAPGIVLVIVIPNSTEGLSSRLVCC